MRRAAASLAAFFSIAAATLLTGCWNGKLLYSFERPFASSLGDEGPLRAALARVSLSRGYLPVFSFDAGVDPVATLQQDAARGYAVIAVGPLASFQWQQFAPARPAVRFVLVDVPAPAGAVPPNVVFLTFDRTAAFREAGRAAAEAVRASAEAGLSPAETAARIGVLAADGSGLLPAEAEAFSAGAAAVLDGARPVSRTLPAVPDPEAVRAAVTQMRSDGVAVFLLGLGERDPSGLGAIRDAGGAAVVSDWRESAPLPAQVLASVEEDVPAGIARALAAPAASRAVNGPVRLVKGRKI